MNNNFRVCRSALLSFWKGSVANSVHNDIGFANQVCSSREWRTSSPPTFGNVVGVLWMKVLHYQCSHPSQSKWNVAILLNSKNAEEKT